MKISVNEINSFVKKEDFFNLSDMLYWEQLEKAVDLILKNKNEKPIVLLCGPSGAGKTTAANNLKNAIVSKGVNCEFLSMDNYFFSLSQKDKELGNNANLEEPTRVDFELLKTQLNLLIDNKEVYAPYYDFINSIRIDNYTKITRNNGILIVEGIHSLNTNYLDLSDKCTKIYLNVGYEIEYNNKIFTGRQIRLLRRICRDKVHRNRELDGTIMQYKHVSLGEDNFIKPYKKTADLIINTFSFYEMGCYKFLLDDVLNDQYKEIVGLEEIFMEINEINPKNILPNSHIKEFI